MTARYTWDDHYLYIGYETFDKNLVALGHRREERAQGQPARGLRASAIPKEKVDVVEFFISFGDERIFLGDPPQRR